jgi:hypothetical protein
MVNIPLMDEHMVKELDTRTYVCSFQTKQLIEFLEGGAGGNFFAKKFPPASYIQEISSSVK